MADALDKIPRAAHDSSLDLPLTPAENNENAPRQRFLANARQRFMRKSVVKFFCAAWLRDIAIRIFELSVCNGSKKSRK